MVIFQNLSVFNQFKNENIEFSLPNICKITEQIL